MKHYDQVEEAVLVLRRTLQAAEVGERLTFFFSLNSVAMKDHSVVMVSLGFLLNMASLLVSPPDQISPLTGYQLVQTKVIPG